MRVGITGVPGVGKSTTIDALGTLLTGRGHRVAVLAVDPSSSRTGGSILGDKTRMARLAVDRNAFIRPSPSSGTLGGVAARTRETMLLCEAAGFDVVLVETVGIGQSETAVSDMTDFFLALMLPGAGDELQGIKKGVLEIADMIAVNKSDGDNRDRARAAAAEYMSALHILQPASPVWSPPVVLISGLAGEGLDGMWDKIVEHRRRTTEASEFAARRRGQQVKWMWAMLEDRFLARLRSDPALRGRITKLEHAVADGTHRSERGGRGDRGAGRCLKTRRARRHCSSPASARFPECRAIRAPPSSWRSHAIAPPSRESTSRCPRKSCRCSMMPVRASSPRPRRTSSSISAPRRRGRSASRPSRTTAAPRGIRTPAGARHRLRVPARSRVISIRAEWKPRELATALRRAGVPAAPSRDAGAYVCNALLYKSLERKRRRAFHPHSAGPRLRSGAYRGGARPHAAGSRDALSPRGRRIGNDVPFSITSELVGQVLQIVWIDLLLSGDNAVVIALACRNLPEQQRRLGAVLGAGMAILLRVAFTLLVVRLLDVPVIKLVGAILLIVIAVNFLTEEHEPKGVKPRSSVWGAVVTITLADAVMSLDNVLAIAGASRGNAWLIVFGLMLTLPLVVFGARFIMGVIDRFPLIAWAGAGLLGWVAGHMMSEDPVFAAYLDRLGDPPDIVANIGGAAFVLIVGLLLRWRRMARG